MNILITGAKGQLGSDIKKLASNHHKYFYTDAEELDITSKTQIGKFVISNNIDYIINCAAYTAVDKAESEEEKAEKINKEAVKNLAEICVERNISLIHISTDYVFDGKNFKPYTEDDLVNPVSVYGKTKLDGEKELIKHKNLRAIIIRTSWLYSTTGSNFVKSIIKYAKERGTLNVVYDQVGTPTYARDLADSILHIVNNDLLANIKQPEIFHYSNEGVCSWYDFAKEIVSIENINCVINPILSKDYPTPAKRPHYSVFSKEKIKQTFNIRIPFWKDSLRDCLKEMPR